MKSKLKFCISRFNYHFDKKQNLFIFLLLCLGTIIPTVSGCPDNNFWHRLFAILTNHVFNTMLFIAIGLNVIYMASEFSKSYNIVSRFDNYKKIVMNFMQNIIIYTIYLTIVSLILAIAGATLFSFGDFSMIKHPIYKMPMIYYILFYVVRSCVLSSIINVILYLVLIIFKNIMTTIVLISNSLLFLVISLDFSYISHFYNMPILPHYYYTSISYSSFILEFMCTTIELLLLIILGKIMFYMVTYKKRELV